MIADRCVVQSVRYIYNLYTVLQKISWHSPNIDCEYKTFLNFCIRVLAARSRRRCEMIWHFWTKMSSEHGTDDGEDSTVKTTRRGTGHRRLVGGLAIGFVCSDHWSEYRRRYHIRRVSTTSATRRPRAVFKGAEEVRHPRRIVHVHYILRECACVSARASMNYYYRYLRRLQGDRRSQSRTYYYPAVRRRGNRIFFRINQLDRRVVYV